MRVGGPFSSVGQEMPRRRGRAWGCFVSVAALLGAPAALILVLLMVANASALRESDSPYANLATLARVLSHVELSWVGDVDQDALIEGAIRGLVSALDPHSSYLTAEEYRLLGQDTEGRFAGVGVEIEVRDGWIIVLAVMENTPAARAGLKPGDKFLAIAGRPARDMRLQEAVRLMRGEPGTQVAVSLRRRGEADAIERTLTRAMVELDAVMAHALPDQMAYVRLRAFQRGVAQEVGSSLDDLVAQRGELQGLLLDLRDNPGGLLEEAILLSDMLIDDGPLVTTRGRSRDLVLFEAVANRRGSRTGFPVVVLVSGLSASAAEIVAGALQDHRRGLVVGQQTFGKGSVQNIIELPDGSALKLTVARYFTPQGRSLQARGVAPDLPLEDPDLVGESQPLVSEAELPRHLDGADTREAARHEHPRQWQQHRRRISELRELLDSDGRLAPWLAHGEFQEDREASLSLAVLRWLAADAAHAVTPQR